MVRACRPIDRFIGTFRNGKRDAKGLHLESATCVSTQLCQRRPQGYGIARIENESGRRMGQGCISAGGKVAAIGVPRTSCRPITQAAGKVAER